MLINKKVLWITLGALVGILALGAYVLHFDHMKKQNLPSYFTYSNSDVKTLKKLNTSQEITAQSLNRIDELTYTLIRKYKLGDAYAARVFAYLYDAQQDAASLSYRAKGNYAGNIGEISTRILCLFFKNNCQNGRIIEFQMQHDAFSNKVAEIVFQKYQKRYQQEQQNEKEMKIKKGKHNWAGKKPYYGQSIPSWKPWRIKSANQFMAKKPESAINIPYWKKQTELTKEALKKATPKQIKETVFWAGGFGTLTPPGIWIKIANDYMNQINTPLHQRFTIRADLAMTLTDACIAAFYSKYSYWIKRPNMQDTSIITIMPTPNHPSYPAAHSTISAAAATVLIHFFPQKKKQWERLLFNASTSRVWGGIHFYVDDKAGMELGKQVAQYGLKK